MEEWKQIPGYNNRYEVSIFGRIRNIDGRIISPYVTKKGYNRVQLYLGGNKKKSPYLHRLVAKAFIPNPDELPQINHKDTNKKNNSVGNLEWCTNQQNSDHAKLNGLKISLRGEKNPRSTITAQQAIEIRDAILNKNFLRKELAKKYGVSVHIVKDIRSRRSWKHL